MDQIASLSPVQVAKVYACARDDKGKPIPEWSSAGPKAPSTPLDFFRLHLKLIGITEEETVQRLYKIHKASPNGR